jgi:uncharacterized repeat protein (TIGR01451 family)
MSGDRASFSIFIQNTGNVRLTGVQVSDPLASNCNRNNLGSLNPGDVVTYTCSRNGITADFTNTATVSGQYAAGSSISDSDTAFVDVINPDIVVIKTPDEQQVRTGGTANFTIVVNNTGDVTLDNIQVSDPLAPDCRRPNLGSLIPGGSVAYTCAYEGVIADFTNTASVSGRHPLGDSVSDSDTAAVDAINPNIALAKTPDSQTIVSGGTANFTIVITNTGDVTLANIQVSDPLAASCNRPDLGSLTPNNSTSYTCSRSGITAGFLNEAAVTGQDPLGDHVSDSDAAFVDVNNPNITIDKSPDTQTVFRGDTAAFTIIVVNSSNTIDLIEVEVSDPSAPNCNRSIGNLAAMDNFSYTCTLANVTGGFTNLATVTGVHPTAGVVSDSDVAVVELLDIDVTVSANPPSLAESGSLVEFTVVTTNHSSKSVTLTALNSVPYGNLTDPNNNAIQDSTCILGVVISAEGGAYTCSFTAAVSGPPATYDIRVTAEANGGDVSNTGSAAVTIIAVPQTLFLPVLARNHTVSEPNNLPCQAYSLTLNQDHYFLADDVNDWYHFDVATAGHLVIALTNFVPIEGQIIAYAGSDCGTLELLQNNGDFSPTKILDLGTQPAGHYYIWVINDGPLNNTNPYRLRINFP